MKNIIQLTDDNGHSGSAKIEWIEENQYNMAHYAAFISVPFQNSRWENLFVYKKEDLQEAEENAKNFLKIYLSRCTLCG